ncbi:MAG: hypothetical protein GYA21_01770 [Myxococcales bacterium]|nr:hypothetical protein [Myxococcales bacterium]
MGHGAVGWKRLWCTALVAACFLAACRGNLPPAESEISPFEVLFPQERFLEIRIEMDGADWVLLNGQNRDIWDLLGQDCLNPRQSPFTYFPANIEVDPGDGRPSLRLTKVGIRKKCFFGSCNQGFDFENPLEKPALKIKADHYVSGQRLLGMRHLTLNNCRQDPSYIRQCLGYLLFERAGVPSPRCAFAHVTVSVDGREADLGVYAHVQAVQKEFLAQRFLHTHGNLYEGAVSDFRPAFVETFVQKTNRRRADRSDLDRVVEALEKPDSELLPALEPLIALDEFVSFWAMEVLLGHWDGYNSNRNNFYLYHDPFDGRFHFIPWGIDAILVDEPTRREQGKPETVLAESLLGRRLYLHPEGQRAYLERLRALLDSVFVEPAVVSVIDRFEAMLRPVADPAGTGEFSARVNEVRSWVQARRGVLEAELSQGPARWDFPLSGPPCFNELGELSGSFETTYGTLGAPDPFQTGTGSLTGRYRGQLFDTVLTGSMAGLDPNPDLPPERRAVLVEIAAWQRDNTALVALISIPPWAFVPGIDLDLGFWSAVGILYKYDPSQPPGSEVSMLGILMNGTLHLDSASMISGEAVRGHLASKIFETAN